jgi:DNA-binding GntR family transcriptional regulator
MTTRKGKLTVVRGDRPVLARVQTHTRLTATTEAIRSYVVDGHVPTGARLTDQQLVEALGVSRATVREAVRQLVHEGILEHEPYKGLRVATLDDQGWLDLAEVRAALEVPAARRLASDFSPEIEKELERGLRRLREARRAHSAAEENHAHIEFHALIQHLAGNPILERTWEVIEQRARVMLRVDHEIHPDEDRVATHARLVDAIRSRDPDAAARAVNEHVLVTAQEQVQARRAIALIEATSASVAKKL